MGRSAMHRSISRIAFLSGPSLSLQSPLGGRGRADGPPFTLSRFLSHHPFICSPHTQIHKLMSPLAPSLWTDQTCSSASKLFAHQTSEYIKGLPKLEIFYLLWCSRMRLSIVLTAEQAALEVEGRLALLHLHMAMLHSFLLHVT